MSTGRADADAPFSLERFEQLAYRRDREPAARELVRLLALIDRRYGHLGGLRSRRQAGNVQSLDAHLLTRLASALSCLLSDPGFRLSDLGFEQLISHQRWLSALFAATPFGNADHVLAALGIGSAEGCDMRLAAANLARFCLLYSADSELPLDVDALWAHHREAAAALLLALLSPRFLGTPAAHAKREVLLGWLPAKLAELDTLDALPQAILHDVYMHCSYATRPDKHEIKRQLNRLIRKGILARGWADPDLSQAGVRPVQGKPVLVVVLEWFTAPHSVFRTHSASMRGLRERFHLVGMGGRAHVDDAGRGVFDEFIDIEGTLADAVEAVRAGIARLAPAVVYYPAVGMFPLTIFLSNMRLAPVQVTALGHGASTLSEFMDYFAVDEDFIGDASTFSECLLRLPPTAMPHVPSSDHVALQPRLDPAPAVVRIAVTATTMKLNPRLLAACREIARQARTPVHFDFICGLTHGLTELQVRRFIASQLPAATVHGSRPYADYLALLNECDMFVSPFPYGNMNGIVDTAQLGLAGVCRVGPQVHERIDAGLFARLGMPGWLVAPTDEAYVAAAVRLADGHAERLALRRDLLARDAVQAIFRGDPEILGERLHALVPAVVGARAVSPACV